MTPLMFVSALLQYNSAIPPWPPNVRLRWAITAGVWQAPVRPMGLVIYI
jgi:hypothetical protein